MISADRHLQVLKSGVRASTPLSFILVPEQKPPRMVNAIALGTCATLLSFPATAQITPDATLGSESSVVTPDELVRGELADLIEGGAIRDSNLFHSFSEFNVNEGQRVYFANPAGIESILSRITGGNPSNVFGTLGVDGPADLFLLNPNGILFGENVALDIEGSFYAATADAIGLGDGVFSAVDPERSQLLTVDPSVYFENYLSNASGDIENQGRLAAGENLTLAANRIESQGQIIAGGDLTLLASNDVSIIDSSIDTSGSGNVSDIIISAGGTVRFDGRAARADSALAEGEGNSGDIRINATNLEVTNGARLIAATLGSGDAGNVVIEAQGNVVFEGASADGEFSSGAFSSVGAGGMGSGGNVEITAHSLKVANGAQLAAGALRSATGNSGNVEITAHSVEVTNGGQLIANTRGTGDAGNVVVEAQGHVVFEGANADGESFSGAFSRVDAGGRGAGGNVEITAHSLKVANRAQLAAGALRSATGNSGNVEITAHSVEVTNGGRLIAGTEGTGDAGNVVIEAQGNVVFEGASADGESYSGASSNVGDNATGMGGNVEITAHSVEVTHGAQLAAATLGTGDAGNVVIEAQGHVVFDSGGVAFSNVEDGGVGAGGNVEITTHSLEVANGAQLIADTRGTGDAGNVEIIAQDRVVFEGVSADGNLRSAAFSSVADDATGTSGNVKITSHSLEVTNGAFLNASTLGTGDAGNVVIEAQDSVVFDSGGVAFSNVEDGGVGAGGNVEITTHSLEVANGAQLAAATLGTGDAGNVVIEAQDSVIIDGVGSAVFSNVESPSARGAGGNVAITANSVEVTRGAQLIADTRGTGDAGNVAITANSVEVTHGAQLTASAEGTGNAGKVVIKAQGRVIFDNSAVFSSVGVGATGNGGNVEIAAENLEMFQAGLLASSEGVGNAGNITLLIADQITIDGNGISTASANASGGRVVIRADSVILKNNASIQTFVDSGAGIGGDIIIIADFVIALDDSEIAAFSVDGQGGNIDLSQTTFFGQNARIVSGNLSRDAIFALDGNSRVDVIASGAVAAGQVAINDTSFIENSFNELSDDLVSPEVLTAGSCIARGDEAQGSFIVTGGGGLPQQPGDEGLSAYPTGTVRTIPETPAAQTIQEPDGVYQLADGRIVLSHECQDQDANS